MVKDVRDTDTITQKDPMQDLLANMQSNKVQSTEDEYEALMRRLEQQRAQEAQAAQSQQGGGMPVGMIMDMFGGEGGGFGLESLFGGGSELSLSTVSTTGGSAAGGTAGASAAGTAGASAASGSAAGGAAGSAAAGGGGGFGSAMAAAGPWAALAAVILANENYQGNIGNRDDESFTGEYALTGRAFYMDAPGWADKMDGVLEGSGSGVRIAGYMSSPLDMFEGDTWSGLWDEVSSGGTLGNILGGLF